jgi:predicted O-methyltransferase YrrM
MEPKYHRMFRYDRNLLPNKFLAGLEEGVEDIESARRRSGLTIGYPGWNFLYYCVLCSLSREMPNVIIETGTNIGCSTIVLAQALLDSGLPGHVDSVELDQRNHEQAKINTMAAGVASVVTLHLGDSKNFLQEFVKKQPSIRFVFLDGSHAQSDVVREFEIIHPFLRDESIVFFDNTFRLDPGDPDQKVNGALKEITRRFGGNLVNFENTSWYPPGQAVWQKHGFAKDW